MLLRSLACVLLLLGFLALPGEALGQSATVRGFITDDDTGEPMELVAVTLRDGAGETRGAVTTGEGFYIITGVPTGRYAMRASFLGYASYTDTLDVTAGQVYEVNVVLSTEGGELEEVLVESERSTGSARITAGQQIIRPADIERIPTLDAAGDLATLLTSLPGIVSTGDRGGQFFVRGGEPTHNLVQIDGMMLYQPFHILGFYSTFPADIINQTNVYAGGFGSGFGERISSVIDVTTRSGNNRRFTGSGSISPFIAGLQIEGPIIPGQASLLVSVRESLVEDVAAPIINDDLPYVFGDAFGKLSFTPSSNQRLSFTALRTHDRGSLLEDVGSAVEPEELRWRNEAIGGRYLILPREYPVSFRANAAYSRLTSSIGPPEQPSRVTEIQNFNAQIDITFFGPAGAWNAGTSIRLIELESNLGGTFQNLENRSEEPFHWGMYLEPEFEMGDLKIRPGIRAQIFDVQFEPFWEPRLRLVWTRPKSEWSAAAGMYQQAIIGLYDRRDAASVFTAYSSAIRPTDRLDDISEGRVQRAWHGLVGYRANPTSWLEVSAEGYAKLINNLFISEWTAYPRFTTNLQPAEGRSFGFDLRAEVRRPGYYLSATYGYSNTEYQAKQAELQLWYGTETLAFRPPHDRRHQVNLLASTTLAGIDLSARWEFGSGLPFSRVVGFDGFAVIDDIVDPFSLPTERRVIYERPFSGLLPAYHRLDLSGNYTIEMPGAALTVSGSLINVYNRANLFYLDVFTLRRVDQLPFVPSLGVKITV
ncbi:MAG: TonB-dependent receptor [Bacteroidota bacterium]